MACGTTDKDVVNAAFAGRDPEFKRCSLKDFVESQTRNILTFGRAATQIILNENKIPVMFRPLPVETIRNVVYGENPSIGQSEETAEESLQDLKEYNDINKARNTTPIAATE